LNESRDEMNKMEDRETWYRVPHSAEECAVHMEAGGVVEVWRGDRWVSLEGSCVRSVDFRLYVYFRSYDYRLVYSTPVGMSPVIGAPARAYGLAKDAPEGWEAAMYAEGWVVGEGCQPNAIIEARPPAPAPEPRTEKVPLTKLAGRTLVGALLPVYSFRPDPEGGFVWWAAGCNTEPLSVDVDSGMVEVLAEEEAW